MSCLVAVATVTGTASRVAGRAACAADSAGGRAACAGANACVQPRYTPPPASKIAMLAAIRTRRRMRDAVVRPAFTMVTSLTLHRKISLQISRSANYYSVGNNLLVVYGDPLADNHERDRRYAITLAICWRLPR